MKVKEILNQFNLKIPLNEEMLDAIIEGDVKYTRHHTEYHKNLKTKEKELVYVIEGTRIYSRGPEKIELLINPKTYKRGKITKEMIDYNTEYRTAIYFNEDGIARCLKQYIKNLPHKNNRDTSSQEP